MSRRNPFDDLERMFDRMSRQFEQLDTFDRSAMGGVALDVEDVDDAFVVTADLPGFERDDIVVELEDTQLRLAAEQSSETAAEEEEPDGTYIHRERTRTAVSRTVQLPERVVASETEATYTNGVLTVRLPKRRDDGDSGTNIPVN
jgi:HSP20 family protein